MLGNFFDKPPWGGLGDWGVLRGRGRGREGGGDTEGEKGKGGSVP